MSVVGIDFGAQSTKIGVARNKGIDIITNEVSNRATPSLVGFNARSRAIGEAAKTQETSNLKNTIGSLKRLIGRSFDDPDVQVEQQFTSSNICDVNGLAGVEVNYLGKKEKFTATQLVAMYLTKIKDITSAELKLPVSDVTISVPAWFTDVQRRAMIDAGEIAGLNVLRLVNDTTATALGYGITKLDLPGPDEKPRRVAFVDIGYSDYTATIVEFRKGELNVKSTAYDRHFGGRDFDKALTEHFAEEFKEKFKVDIRTNPKAWSRTLAAAEKLKKVLSANPQAPLSIESLMEDTDVRAMVKRDELEGMIKALLDRITVPLEQALSEAKLKVEDIDHIEMVGGCTRVPAIKDTISNFFGKGLSFTLNQDEAIARGCAFCCATLSPVFRVRDFAIHDIVNYPVDFTWEQSSDIPDEDTSLTVFSRGNVMPSTKILTFYRKQPFDLEARYAKPEQMPGKINPWIGRFSVKGVQADANDDFMICKLKARLNLHGILNVESGYYVEDMEVEEPVPEEGEKKDGDAMDTDKADEQPKKTRKVKKQVRKGDLPIVSGSGGIDEATKSGLHERENAMYMEDKLVAETDEKKNELEGSIYELRDKIDGIYSEFANDDEKEKLRAKLSATEDWLYEDGEDTTKSVYVSKMDDIRFIAGPIIQRYKEKVEAEREVVRKAEEEAAAKKRAELEAKKQAEDEAKKADADAKGAEGDAEMKDAPAEGEAAQGETEEKQ